MLSHWQLPYFFNPPQLQADLAKIDRDEWVPHFNTGYYQGEWSGIALRSVGGVTTQLYPDPTADGKYANTSTLDKCTYIQAVLTKFPCQLEAVRFLKLTPGSSIREHTDYNLGFEDGFIRLHIPVVTNPEVEFYLQGRRLPMQEGECWYINFNLPHSVYNRSSHDRVHLVIDCVVNDWMRELFAPCDLPDP